MPGYDPTLLNPPQDTTQPPPTNTTSGINQSGVPGFLQNVGQFVTGSNNPLTNASLIPAEAMAAQQWHNAGQYTQLGQTAANRADPFGNNNNRQQYIDQLSALEKDPSQIANTPGYKFALNQALDSTQSRLASQGFLGSSQMQSALAAQSSGLAQQTYNSTIDQLSKLGGAQFDPANAASDLMRGGELAVGSQNAALQSAFYPFGPGAGGTTVNNTNGGGTNSNGSNGLKMPTNQALTALQNAGMNPQTAANLMRQLISAPTGISAADMSILQNTGIIDPSMSNGGVDTAPPTYNYGGYGVDPNTINPSTGNIIDNTGTGNPNWDFTNNQDLTGGGNIDYSGGSSPDSSNFSATDLWGNS